MIVWQDVYRIHGEQKLLIMNIPELKPCPFCGGEGQICDRTVFYDHAKIIRCKRCDAMTRMVMMEHPLTEEKGTIKIEKYTEEQAVIKVAELWNMRVCVPIEKNVREGKEGYWRKKKIPVVSAGGILWNTEYRCSVCDAKTTIPTNRCICGADMGLKKI